MKTIFVIGAGRSVGSLIEYLSREAKIHNWQIYVGDQNLELAEKRAALYDNVVATLFDVKDIQELVNRVSKSDLVISMLPAHMHHPVAQVCVEHKKPLLTASYCSDDITSLNDLAVEKNTLILMEMGLDPGIDHMSAMRDIDQIREKGGDITLFKSFTGGLISSESDTNPWHYKITWNPRNVVIAGQGGVKFKRNGRYKFIPYHNLFDRTEDVVFNENTIFEGYPNRDSLKYEDIYGLEGIPTILRGTLRKKPFSKAWNILVKLGLTDDKIFVDDFSELTYRDFTNAFLPYDEVKKVEQKIRDIFNADDESLELLDWLGLFSNKVVGVKNWTAAQILQKLIEEKWKLEDDDKDMIVMQHQIQYKLNGKLHEHKSSLMLIGDDASNTSMAKTVGLPLGIAAKLILLEKISLQGVKIPISKEIYEPVLKELKELGVFFTY